MYQFLPQKPVIDPHLVAQFVGSEEIVRVPAQGLTKADLMGELALIQTLPTYQLALPFSQEAWRQLEYANGLFGTTFRDSTSCGSSGSHDLPFLSSSGH